jgi:hypothetical protein
MTPILFKICFIILRSIALGGVHLESAGILEICCTIVRFSYPCKRRNESDGIGEQGAGAEGVTGGSRERHNYEFHDMHSSTNIIRVINSRRIKYTDMYYSW